MNLYIQIRDGQPFQHPIFEDNFKEAFPDVDTQNLPPEFAKFIRLEPPEVPAFKVLLESYVWAEDGSVQDNWTLRAMNSQELGEALMEIQNRATTINLPGSAPDVID